MSRVKAASSPASPPLTSGSVGVMVEKRRHRSDRCRLIPVSAVCTRGERLHKIRDRPSQQFLSLAQLRSLPIPITDEAYMQRVVDILSAYDDLIENNRRQIKLLEEAAQRLYREWFVELRFPGHEDVKIVDEVPEGWRVETVCNICCTIGGGTPSTKEKSYYEGGNIPCVTPTDITRNGCLILLETEKKIKRKD